MVLSIDEVRPIERPVDAIGDARRILPPIIAGEAVEREQVAVLEVDRTSILVRDVEVRRRRRQHELNARDQPLHAAKQRADERPLDVRGQSPDRRGRASHPPPDRSARRARGIVRVIEVAAAISGQGELLAPWREAPQVPLRAGKGALRVLPVDAAGSPGCWPAARACRRRCRPCGSGRRLPAAQSESLLFVVGAQALERPAGDGDIAESGLIRSALTTLRRRSSLVMS